MITHNNKAPDRGFNHDESIDLIDLFIQLWRGKIVIALFVVTAIILAGIYLVLAEEKWTSSAIITFPDSGQVSSYTNAMNTLYPGHSPSVSDVQGQFFSRFNAALSVVSLQLSNQEIPAKLSIEPTVKGQSAPLQVSYTGENPQQAAEMLNKYITDLNKAMAREIDENLNNNINSRISELVDALQAKESVAKERLVQREKIINRALMVADQTHVTKPLIQQSEKLPDDTLFVLGSDALKAMIKDHESSPLPLGGDYYALRQNLLAVQALKSQPDTLHIFRYVMKPDLPIRRDSPKRGLTLILAVLLGGIIGCGAVLARNAIAGYNRQHKA